METKLTLRLDEYLIQQAEIYAEDHDKSLSQLVAEYFFSLASQNEKQQQQIPPITQSLRGILRGAKVDEQDYKQYLEKRYL